MSLKDTMQFSNFASTTLAEAISSSATQLRLAGNASAFPTLGEGQIFTLVVSEGDKYEIMYCTARTGDLLTVERAQENTTARSFSTRARVVHTVTAAFFESAVERPDPTVLLLHFDELIAAAPPTSYASSYIDSSPNGFHVSMPGWANPEATDLVAASLNTSDKRFGAACLGGDANLVLAVEPDPDVLPSDGGGGAYLEAFGFGVGDFTIEFQVRRFSGASTVASVPLNIYSVNNASISFSVGVGGTPSSGAGVSFISDEGNVTLPGLNHPSNQWFHIALSVNTVDGVRTARLYHDGVLRDSADITGFDFGSAGQCFISALHRSLTSSSLGNIDEIRIVKGVGLYPTGFDPPTGPFS